MSDKKCQHHPSAIAAELKINERMNLLPNFQKGGGLDRTSSFYSGVAGKEGVTFFRGVAVLRQKIGGIA